MLREKKKVILDVDTGSDDAVAIMSAVLSGELNVMGILVSFGNQPLKYTLSNTLRVVDLLRSKVSVFKGCAFPLVQDLIPGRMYNTAVQQMEHEIDGTMVSIHERELPLPEPFSVAQSEHGCAWLLHTLREAKEKITLIPVGPLTNIATVLRMDPSVSEHIEEIVCMGGGINVHNVTPCAEINFWNDPEAAKIVINSGVPITVVTLDATHSSWFGYQEVDCLRSIGNPAADFAAEMLYHRISAANQLGVRHEPKSALHDVLAVCAVIDRSVLIDVRREKCDVDIGGGSSNGQLYVDRRDTAVPDKPTNIAYSADGNKLFQMLYSHLMKFDIR